MPLRPLTPELADNPRFVAWYEVEEFLATDKDEFFTRLQFELDPIKKRALWYRACGKSPPPKFVPIDKERTELTKMETFVPYTDKSGKKITRYRGGIPSAFRHFPAPVLTRPTYETKKKVAPAWTGSVLRAIQRTGQLRKSLVAAGVSEMDYFFWKGNDLGFSRAVDRAVVESADLIEDRLQELATDGDRKGIWYKGVRVGEEREVSVSAAKILLDGLKPERYVEPAALAEAKAARQGTGSFTMNITIQALGGESLEGLPPSIQIRGASSPRTPEQLMPPAADTIDAEVVSEEA